MQLILKRLSARKIERRGRKTRVDPKVRMDKPPRKAKFKK